jgi:3-phosphoshikimate 1-carboxyvinyltransferase
MNKNKPLISSRSGPLTGIAKIPGDKSISHRALMLGSIAHGETIISGLLEGEDVLHTAQALKDMGAKIFNSSDGLWRIQGTGDKGLKEPEQPIEMGNSGTSTRLLMGLVSGFNIRANFTGDASLSNRPMGRVIKPLTLMGAEFRSSNEKLPITLTGTNTPKSLTYELPVASAQVKSAVLLAGLNAEGTTIIIENKPTRDHTENMLQKFGVDIKTHKNTQNQYEIKLKGKQKLIGCAIDVPGDPSSAAFPMIAATIIKNSKIKLPHIGVNNRRIGALQTLIEMGPNIELKNKKNIGGEEVADIYIEYKNALKGINIPKDRVPSMIDEFPILSIAAACANGTTIMEGLGELRVKESDRLGLMAENLKKCGVELEEGKESLIIHGKGKPPKGGCIIDTQLDHRIAMSFLVLGCVSEQPIEIDDSCPINTSFPNFADLMNDLGSDIYEPGKKDNLVFA